jgi:hypothetical protein
MHRPRLIYVFAILIVIAAGLASRSPTAAHLPHFLATYSGDTLWALTVFLILGFIFQKAPTITLAAAAVAISFSVEFSQLYQAPWIIQLRQTLPGKLLLGAGFLWSDLLCYLSGIAIGVMAETLTRFHKKPEPTQGEV